MMMMVMMVTKTKDKGINQPGNTEHPLLHRLPALAIALPPCLHVRRLIRSVSWSWGPRFPATSRFLPWGDPLVVVGVLGDHPHHDHVDPLLEGLLVE